MIALDIIEDFLVGEGHKFLRLVGVTFLHGTMSSVTRLKQDGNTKGTDRQKGMDEFNRPGSDVFIYLLTTRAGVSEKILYSHFLHSLSRFQGVGINLFVSIKHSMFFSVV